MASLVVSGAIVEAPEGTNTANNYAGEVHGPGGHECFESPRSDATPDFATTIESDLQSPYRIVSPCASLLICMYILITHLVSKRCPDTLILRWNLTNLSLLLTNITLYPLKNPRTDYRWRIDWF